MEPQKLLVDRLAALGAVQPVDFLDRVMPAIRSWLFELLRSELPDKKDVLQWVDESLQKVLKSHEFKFADEFLDAVIRSAIVNLTDALYDQLVDLTRKQAV